MYFFSQPILHMFKQNTHQMKIFEIYSNVIFLFSLMKMEYSVFKWKRRKMAAEICSARAGLYKSWHCFRRMCSFSLFKNKGIL